LLRDAFDYDGLAIRIDTIKAAPHSIIPIPIVKIITNYRWLILIILLIAGAWYANSQQNATTSSQPDDPQQANGARTKTNRTPEEPRATATHSHREAAKDPLANVRSPLAKRYLRFMLPGGRLNGESYGISIVTTAFKEAWGVTARIDLTEEQQDRLAEFLLQEDFMKLIMMDRVRVEKWAKEHLTDAQRTEFLAFIDESMQGQRDLSDLRMELNKKEQGAGTAEEAFTAEMRDSARIAEMLAKDPDKLTEEEAEKLRAELKSIVTRPTALADAADDAKFKETYQGEQAAQFFHLLADRIPLTEQQQRAIYVALHKGATPPTNAYDYQQRPADQIEAEVRSTTDWMSKALTQEQYETYLRHYLAEIEMIRFQISQ
jgi:hypothetical protein